MVYDKYLKSYTHFNTIFGEGNWTINNYLEQLMIYCAFFEFPFPASFKYENEISKEYLYIGFIDNPTFQTFHEKHPKMDKTKPITIHSCNNNEKIIIRALMMETIDKTSHVVLNKLNVCKLNVLHFSILKNIKNGSINDNFKLINYYSCLNSVVIKIFDMTNKLKNDKDALKEKHMKAIAKIDEMCSINIFDEVNQIQTNINASSSASTEASNVASSSESASNVASSTEASNFASSSESASNVASSTEASNAASSTEASNVASSTEASNAASSTEASNASSSAEASNAASSTEASNASSSAEASNVASSSSSADDDDEPPTKKTKEN